MRTVLPQAFVHQGDDLVQRVGLRALVGRRSADQAVDPLDVLGAAKKRPGRGGGFGQALGRPGVLLERNQVGVRRRPARVQSFHTQS